MISELALWLKSRKLAPLNPAPMTSSPPATDQNVTARRRDLTAWTTAAMAKTTSASPSAAWQARAT
jgi:hypothetical protein